MTETEIQCIDGEIYLDRIYGDITMEMHDSDDDIACIKLTPNQATEFMAVLKSLVDGGKYESSY